MNKRRRAEGGRGKEASPHPDPLPVGEGRRRSSPHPEGKGLGIRIGCKAKAEGGRKKALTLTLSGGRGELFQPVAPGPWSPAPGPRNVDTTGTRTDIEIPDKQLPYPNIRIRFASRDAPARDAAQLHPSA